MATNTTRLAKSGKFGDLRRRLVFLLLALMGPWVVHLRTLGVWGLVASVALSFTALEPPMPTVSPSSVAFTSFGATYTPPFATVL